MMRLIENAPQCKIEYLVDGTLAGFLHFSFVFESCDIIDIEVLPAFRRQGIASALFDRFFDYLKDHKVETVLLEVRKSNTPAIALYEKFGFSLLNERKEYYQNPVEDALIYRRTILC